MTEQEEFEFRRRREMEREMSHEFIADSTRQRQPSNLSDIPAGIVEGVKKFGIGALQRAMELTGNPRAGFMAQHEANRRRQTETDSLLKGAPSFARSTGELIGEASLPIALSALTGPSLLGGTAAGAISGLMRPSVSKEETLSNALLEGTAALGTGLATRAVLPRPRIEPEHRKSLEAGRKAGLEFTGGQISDNPIVHRAEAHALWNPLTKWHLQPFVNKQDDEFVKRVMQDIGVPRNQIPKNPSLDAATLQSVRDELGKRFEQVFPAGESIDLSLRGQRGLHKAMMKASQQVMLSEERAIVKDAINEVRSIAGTGQVPAKTVQDLLELLSETSGALTDAGKKKAANAIDTIYDELLKTIKDPKAYEAVKADYARLMTIEDLLRRSSGMTEGIPDKTKLAKSIERNMPGGVLYDRSSMAGTARGGQQTAMVGALPGRSTGLPMPSDVPNALTYFRYNNPASKYGMLNPTERDIAEILLRYLPGTAARRETEPLALSE